MNASSLSQHQTRQPHLPEIAAVKIIGLGGVGGIVARYAALYLASLGHDIRLVLIDGDSFEPSNQTRMFFGGCGNKAAVLRNDLLPRFAQSALTLLAVEEYLSPHNADRLLQNGDIILLTVDNHATRKLANDRCADLDDVCLISGGNDGVGKGADNTMRRGTYGNVQVVLRANSQALTPPLTYHHPEIANPIDRLPTDQSCAELVTSVPQILFANLAVASAMLNTLWLCLEGDLRYGELALDIAHGLMRPVATVRPHLSSTRVL